MNCAHFCNRTKVWLRVCFCAPNAFAGPNLHRFAPGWGPLAQVAAGVRRCRIRTIHV